MKSNTVDMCSGPLFKNIMEFAIPFMLMGILQRFYNAADVIVVGRYAGQEVLAGVGTTTSLNTLLVNLFLGLSAGVSVVLGRALGAKDDEAARKTVHTAILLSVTGGIIISLIGVIFSKPLLKLIGVPDNVMIHAMTYMRIIFAGKVFALVFNFGSAVLRAAGDTKRPLFIATVSGIINVVLNLFFVLKLGMQAEGVALATIISQMISAAAVLWTLHKEHGVIHVDFKKLKIDKTQFVDILKIGVPCGIQNSIFSVSNVIVQSGVNSFGSAAIAGSAAAANIGGFYYIIFNSFFQASVAFVSQNVGAKKYDRINKIILWCLFGVTLAWCVTTLVTIFFGRTLIEIYAPGDEETIKMGLIRLHIAGGTYGLCGFMEVMSGALRGMGHSFKSMLSSIIGVCGIRILWILTVFPAFRSFEMLFISFPLSWIGTFLFHTCVYIYAKRSVVKKEAEG